MTDAPRRPWRLAFWGSVAIASAAILVVAILPVAQRAWALSELREAGFDVQCEGPRNPAWCPRWTRDVFARALAVRGGSVSGGARAALRRLPELESLDVAGDESLVRAIHGLRRLRHLSLRGERIGDRELEQLPVLQDLVSLDLREIRVGAHGLSGLARFPRLERLTLSGTPLTADALRSLERLKGLKSLDLENTGLTESQVRSLEQSLPGLSIADD